MVNEYLQPPVLKGITIEKPKNCLVYEVLQCADQYLKLLSRWDEFTTLLENFTTGNDWLFNRPELESI